MQDPQLSRRPRPYAVAALGVLAFLLCAYGSYVAGYQAGTVATTVPPPSLKNPLSLAEPSLVMEEPSQAVDFSQFWRTWYILEHNFVPSSTSTESSSTTEERVVGAIAGLAASYHDPYTVFIPKKEADSFKESVNGEFEGIGAALTTEDGVTTVTAILPKSPAEAAGLEKGARILAVDGAPVHGLPLSEIIPRIRGPKGSEVVLTIQKDENAPETALPITRGTVAIPTTATKVVTASRSVIEAAVARAKENARSLTGAVAAAFAEEKALEASRQEFFTLRLAAFAKSSVDAFLADLGRFAESDTPYLIIDLRNNPGGYLEVAVDLASYFLPEGTLIVTDRSSQSRLIEYRSKGHHLLDNIAERRIVVIVNRNSASASEILAGALQDHGIAKVVGERSFGKGSVQTLVDIGNLGSLKVTISRWYTPQGKNISESGIVPDIVVDPSLPLYASSTDPFLDAATAALLDDSLWEKDLP